MKWNFGNSVVTLFSASLLCISNHGLASASSPEMVSISQTFREPKNIALAGGIGGTSHFAWVLSIMDELANRGHNMTFFAKVSLIYYV
jgi:hypothetical protein